MSTLRAPTQRNERVSRSQTPAQVGRSSTTTGCRPRTVGAVTTANERAPVASAPGRVAGGLEQPATPRATFDDPNGSVDDAGRDGDPLSHETENGAAATPHPGHSVVAPDAPDAGPSVVSAPGGAEFDAGTDKDSPGDESPPTAGGNQPGGEAIALPALPLSQRAIALGRREAINVGHIAARVVSNAWRDRVMGLAAEAGFWQLLSLPPLLLAMLGSIGYLGDAMGSNAVNSIRNSLLHGATELLTAGVVNDTVRPTVDQILTHGRPDVISIGFVLSLWTGSTAMATFVNTISIAYGQRDLRSAVRSRLVALRLYISQVVTGVIILPSLVLGPDLLARLLRAQHHPLIQLLLQEALWPVAGVVALAMLTSLYHLALPVRRPWRQAVPGALFALIGWLIGSYLLRFYLERVFGNELVYGSLAAPAAALLFFYITALAVLLGAELNAALDQRGAGVASENQHVGTDPVDE
jgi:membrane protein